MKEQIIRHSITGELIPDWLVEKTAEKMDPYFALFNLHKNQAGERAKQEFIRKWGQDVWDKEMKPFEEKGIMSIFQQPPNQYTSFYVGRVHEMVNEEAPDLVGLSSKKVAQETVVNVREWFERAFEKKPEEDQAYFEQWVERWKDDPRSQMDLQNQRLFDQMKEKGLGKKEVASKEVKKLSRTEIRRQKFADEQKGNYPISEKKENIEKEEATPPGFEHVVKKLKTVPGVDNPWAVAWWMKNHGYRPKHSSLEVNAAEVEIEFDINDEELLKKIIEEFNKEGDAQLSY